MNNKIHYIALLFLATSTCWGQTSTLGRIDDLLMDLKYAEAIQIADQAIASSKDLGERSILTNKKIEALIGQGKLQDAGKLIDETQNNLTGSKKNDLAIAITRKNAGYLNLNLGRYDLAEESLNESLGLFETAGKAEGLDAAQTHGNLGLTYMAMGKYRQAQEQLQRSLTLRQKLLKENDERIAAAYNDLGLALVRTDRDKALDYYERAKASYIKIHGNEHPKIAIANINLGVAYRDSKLFGDAVTSFESALKILDKSYTQPHPSKALALFNLGQTYIQMRNNQTAKEFYAKALDMYKACYGEFHPDIAQVLNAMGNLARAENHWAEGFEYYQKALMANVPTFKSIDPLENPGLEDYYNGNILIQTLLFKAQLFEARYYGHTLKFSELVNAIDILKQCDQLADRLRRSSNNESDKLFLGALANEVYSSGLRISYAAAQNAFKKKPYYEDAFYFGEKSKNAVLLDAISESNAKSYVGIPADMLNKEKQFKSSIALLSQKLAQGPTKEEETKLRSSLFEVNRQYEDFIKQLETSYPEYFNLKYNATTPTVKQVQNFLTDGNTLISYSLDEPDAKLYLFVLTNKKYKVKVQPLPEEFDKMLTGYRNSLYYDDINIFKQTSGLLGSLLIPKELESGMLSGMLSSGKTGASMKQVTIIPTGRLGLIPFEALLTEDAETIRDYRSMPYLIRKYAVKYEFSAGLLIQKAQNKSTTSSPAILLCAPVKFPSKDQLQELPGTRNEVEDISALFDSKQYNNTLYTDQRANEAAIKSNDLTKYSYLHFATHGVVDAVQPDLSRIYLQTSSTAEDGNLFAGEIYNLKLKANLVTLSACQTGLGKVTQGEGIIGLSRALVYAGAEHLVVSFWNVADESTAMLMKNFYTEQLEGDQATFASSLAEAKLNLISNEKYSAPYYWAPFVLIGY